MCVPLLEEMAMNMADVMTRGVISIAPDDLMSVRRPGLSV